MGIFFGMSRSLVDTGRPMCLQHKCTAALLVVAQAAMWDLLLPMDKKIRATCAIFLFWEMHFLMPPHQPHATWPRVGRCGKSENQDMYPVALGGVGGT